MCDGIVNDHGGQLELVSPQGAGAVFRVSLPIGIAADHYGRRKVFGICMVAPAFLVGDLTWRL